MHQTEKAKKYDCNDFKDKICSIKLREWSLFRAGGPVEKGGGDIEFECKRLEGAKFQCTASEGGTF